MSTTKRKRSSNPGVDDILSSLESSDRKAAKLRSQISTASLPRSLAAKSQVDIQTNLMECRILMQRALTSLPQVSDDDEDGEGHGDSEDMGASLDKLMSLLVNASLQKEMK
jgi:hypothetical protein